MGFVLNTFSDKDLHSLYKYFFVTFMTNLKIHWKSSHDLTLLPFSLASRSILRSEIRRFLYLLFPLVLWASILYSEVSCADRGLSLRFRGCSSCSSPALLSQLESPSSLLCAPPEATELCPRVSLPLKLSVAESSGGKGKFIFRFLSDMLISFYFNKHFLSSNSGLGLVLTSFIYDGQFNLWSSLYHF